MNINPGLFWLLMQQKGLMDDQGDQAARKAEFEAMSAKPDLNKLRADVRDLNAAINKLTLICRALWEIMAEDKKLDEEYIINKVNEIDLRDGKLDGKMTTAIRVCQSCGRTLFRGHQRCLYCGAEHTGYSPFDSV